jgi:hypothetical protein
MTAGKIIADMAAAAPPVAPRNEFNDPKALLASINKVEDWLRARTNLKEISSSTGRVYIALAMGYSSNFRDFAGNTLRDRFDSACNGVLEKIGTITQRESASPLKTSLTMSQTGRGLQ